MLTVCVSVCCRSLARTEVRQKPGTSSMAALQRFRAHPLRPQASLRLEVRNRRTVCLRALLVCMALPACESTPDICLLHLLKVQMG